MARERGAEVLQGDAHELPFEDDTFAAVVSILTHTDFDDARVAFAEADAADCEPSAFGSAAVGGGGASSTRSCGGIRDSVAACSLPRAVCIGS